MITIDEIKSHARIDGSDEDTYLEFLLSAATEYVSAITEIPYDEEIPARYKHCVLLLVAHLYEHREGVSDAPLKSVPRSFDMLLHSIRPASGLV